MRCYWKKRFFEKKISKWSVTPIFFFKNMFSWTRSSGRVKIIRMFMFKIPDFSLAPRLCKQAGLVSARKDFEPRTLVSGDLRHFDTTVRCAAHYAGATLSPITSLRFLGGRPVMDFLYLLLFRSLLRLPPFLSQSKDQKYLCYCQWPIRRRLPHSMGRRSLCGL